MTSLDVKLLRYSGVTLTSSHDVLLQMYAISTQHLGIRKLSQSSVYCDSCLHSNELLESGNHFVLIAWPYITADFFYDRGCCITFELLTIHLEAPFTNMVKRRSQHGWVIASGSFWDECTYPLVNFNGCSVDTWEWIWLFIQHFTFLCWDLSRPIMVKGPLDIFNSLEFERNRFQYISPKYCESQHFEFRLNYIAWGICISEKNT